jgi:3',5'-cyclic-AMP phosphodiesterase
MTKLIVFTDLHMVPEGNTIIGLDPFKRLETGIEHVNTYHPDADGVIVTGDLVHHGDVVSYQRLKTLLDRLTPPLHLAVGNHDNRENFLSVFTDTVTDENGFVQRALDFADCRALILDSLFAPPYEYPITHAGFLCNKRMRWLEAELKSAKEAGKPVLIFLHHPPHKTGFTGMDLIKLINEGDFYDLVEAHATSATSSPATSTAPSTARIAASPIRSSRARCISSRCPSTCRTPRFRSMNPPPMASW